MSAVFFLSDTVFMCHFFFFQDSQLEAGSTSASNGNFTSSKARIGIQNNFSSHNNTVEYDFMYLFKPTFIILLFSLTI